MSPLRKTDVLLSPLSPEACAARIAAAIDPNISPFGTKSVIGSVTGRAAELQQRTLNSNRPMLAVDVRMDDEGAGGTRLTCTSDGGFVFVVFGGLFAVLLVLGLTVQHEILPYLPILMVVALLATTLGLADQGHHARIVAFVAEITEARPVA